MSAQKWISIRVMKKPLSVIFFYESGGAKGARIDVLYESETEWKNLERTEGGSLPGTPEPFFTRAETAAARRVLSDMGIRLG